MGKVFEAARTCVVQCSNSDTPYRDIENFCRQLRHEAEWTPTEIEEVQRRALQAIIESRRQRKRSTKS
jgi:hypothetical protein